MKKVFTFALVALAAAAVVACQKPASGGTTPGGDTPSGGDYVAIQSIAMEPGVLELEEGESIDLPKVVVTPSNATDKGMPVTWSSKDQNIFKIENNKVVGVKAGTAKIEVVLKDSKGTEFGAQANVTVKAAVPEGQNFDYVMNIADYKTNSEFHFENAKKFNPNSLTYQSKFLSTKWNVYDKVDEERGYKVWCNRLGQICNEGEKGLLFRFGDGEVQGLLRLNSAIFSKDPNYVQKDGKNYIWSLNEWHVLTITSDGTNISVYDNADLVASYQGGAAAVFAEWPVQRFDISMTWDDGTGYDKGQAFLGYIAYTRLWSKALSAAEVAASLCDVPADSEGLEIYWAFNNDEGTTVKNLGKASGYDLDFTKALAGGQASYVKAEDVEGAWTDVAMEELPVVCPAE